MNAPHPLSPSQIERLRRGAKKQARAEGKPLHAALDQAAKANGFSNWSLLMRAADAGAGDAAAKATARRAEGAPQALVQDATIEPALTVGPRRRMEPTTAMALLAESAAMAARQEAVCLSLLRASRGAESGRVAIDAVFRALPVDERLAHGREPMGDKREAVMSDLRLLAELPRRRQHGEQVRLTYMLLQEFSIGAQEVKFRFNPLFIQELQALASHSQVPIY